jgi:hypothetical protein
MAKKQSASKVAAAGKTRVRRTPEQMISDLQAKIREVKQRAKAKELKRSAAIQKTITLARALAKATDLAREEGDTALAHALADAHSAVSKGLESKGITPPKARRPRGRRPSA